MQESKGQIGQAGESLPPFQNHMIRQRVTRHGVIFPLAPSSQLPGCTMSSELVGVVKEGPVKKWLAQKKEWDRRFASAKKKTQKKFIQDLVIGYEGFGEGELPPPSALAGRRKKGGEEVMGTRRRAKSIGLSMWSGWGSKHDKMTKDREDKADKDGERPAEMAAATEADGHGARPYGDIKRQPTAAPASPPGNARSRSRRVTVRDERQTGEDHDVDENTTVAELLAKREEKMANGGSSSSAAAPPPPQIFTPDAYYTPDVGIGTTGKRPYVDGIAVPFSIKKEAETASMMTLTSNMSQHGPASPGILPSWGLTPSSRNSGEVMAGRSSDVNGDHDEHAGKDVVPAHVDGATATPGLGIGTPTMERPGLETFSTAAENLPTVKGPYNTGEVD